jgi:kynurenine formamidase
MLDNFDLIDLTHPLDESVPTWDGECGFCEQVRLDYEQGARVSNYSMHVGIGTHLDAPSHFIKGGNSLEALKLEDFFVPLYVCDLSRTCTESTLIQREAIINYEKMHGKINKRSFFALYTGWSRFWNDPKKYRNCVENGSMQFPTVSKGAAQLLLEREVAGMGVDTLSPDAPQSDFAVHTQILGAGKYIIENLANLQMLPTSGCHLIAFPLNIRRGSESAIRAVACTPKQKKAP